MEIIFVRHGEPDRQSCYERGFMGQGIDLAPLTKVGIAQAEEVSTNVILNKSELIVSSPYTRALQTAAIISKNTQLDISVEIDLHEFIPDKTFQYKSKEENGELHQDFINSFGKYPNGEKRKWETIQEIKNRVLPVIKKYLKYNKIIVVAHGGVIRRFTGIAEVNCCEPYLVHFHKNFICFDWI